MNRHRCIAELCRPALLAVSQAVAAPEKVVIYSSVDEANAKKILDAFSADTGIVVSFVHLSSGPALTRVTAEKANPQAEV